MRIPCGFLPTIPLRVSGGLIVMVMLASGAYGHPLGNFTINHFARVEIGPGQVRLKFVVDMAEIATIQQMQSAGVADPSRASEQELDSYAARATDEYRRGLVLTVDGSRLELRRQSMKIALLPGAGGLNTLRIECGYLADLPQIQAGHTYKLAFEDANHMNRIGWHEVVVRPGAGTTIFDSSAYGNEITDELKAYPQDSLTAPLDERTAHLSFVAGGAAPAGSRALLTRDGRLCVRPRDRLAELIAVPDITPGIVLLGLLLAAGLGALHALSPGHGKTVVGAYLVGSRGTARHAAFLGLTVTITHTAGVFALGIVTLVASRYVLPEQLFPVLSLISGVIVVGIGISLFFKRFGAALAARGRPERRTLHARRDGLELHVHDHGHACGCHMHGGEALDHQHGNDHHGHDQDHCHADAHRSSEDHIHNHGDEFHCHSHGGHGHGGHSHSHLPPGADGSRITWRSLLALGISGGLLPCPSALVVLLAAISLHRIGYGLLLVMAFSVGLASVLSAIGVLFVYAGRAMKARTGGRVARVARLIPIVSALVITCAGAAICWQALVQNGWKPFGG